MLNICFEKYYKKIFPIKNEETNNNRTDIMSITHQNNSSVNRLNLSTIDLINRQEKYINKYNQNKIKNLKEKEKINLELCPFKPMIFTKNSSSPTSLNLSIISLSVYKCKGSILFLKLPSIKTGSWGIIVKFFLKTSSPISLISIPSIDIFP